jgi:cytoskeleton protein RodZ
MPPAPPPAVPAAPVMPPAAPKRDREKGTHVSIGATLAAARRRAGLSLSDVTAVTRVRAPVIEAMENDDFTGCGGDFYARAHIRSVARAVGVDPQPLLAEYDERSGRPSPPAAHEIFEPDVMPAQGSRPNWSATLAVALLVVVGYGLVAMLGGGGSEGSERVAAPVATATGAATGAAAAPARRPAGRPRAAAATQVTDGRVEIRLALAGESWVKATGTDGSPLFQGLLDTGDRKVFRHPDGIRLVVGNADAVRLVVNGYDLGSPDAPGGVLRETYRPGRPASVSARP